MRSLRALLWARSVSFATCAAALRSRTCAAVRMGESWSMRVRCVLDTVTTSDVCCGLEAGAADRFCEPLGLPKRDSSTCELRATVW